MRTVNVLVQNDRTEKDKLKITVEKICTDFNAILTTDGADIVKAKAKEELKKPLLRTSTPNKSKNIESM